MDSNRDIILEKIRNNQAWYEYGTARFRKILSENKGKMQADGTHYYDEKTDRLEQQRYYRKARKHPASGPALFALYHDLVQKTHKNRLPYHVSKNQYLVHVWACIRTMNGRTAHFLPKKTGVFWPLFCFYFPIPFISIAFTGKKVSPVLR
ncbi:hypothetical protein L3V65_13615 [Heyndrickxia coagulans]|uniref:hypothetical protein n=1 Tax=Heyndrickxia TaxID=2837504 RepID=UPI001F2F9FC4|nr:hypothetical protein [Heyndrickxia coagulans]UJZ87242.1 hypothetical protein L3V65_13615 [Heyndrickxia coagulans]